MKSVTNLLDEYTPLTFPCRDDTFISLPMTAVR